MARIPSKAIYTLHNKYSVRRLSLTPPPPLFRPCCCGHACLSFRGCSPCLSFRFRSTLVWSNRTGSRPATWRRRYSGGPRSQRARCGQWYRSQLGAAVAPVCYHQHRRDRAQHHPKFLCRFAFLFPTPPLFSFFPQRLTTPLSGSSHPYYAHFSSDIGANSYYLFSLAPQNRSDVLDALQSAGMHVVRIFITAIPANNKGSGNPAVPDRASIYLVMYIIPRDRNLSSDWKPPIRPQSSPTGWEHTTTLS
jgi:hypothetical protein